MRAPAIGLVVAAGLAAGCGAAVPTAPTLIPADGSDPAPELAYPLLTGAAWSTRAAAGRVIVLDVWATYCAPCRKAFPLLGRLAAAAPDVDVVGLSVDEDDAAVRRFLAEVPAGFSIARDPTQTVEGPPLAIRALPTLILIDRQGRVRLRLENASVADYDALPALVEQLRAE